MKRRTLLTNALLGAPAVQTALLTSAARAAQTAPAEELSADVLVLGAGFAGLASAIAAARAGARVAVLEKRGYAGGDGILSAGILAAAGTPLHEAQGIPGDWSVEAYWQRILDGKEDEPLSKVRDNMPLSPIYSGVAKHNPEVLRRSAFRSPDVAAFVQSFGIEFLPINPHQPFLLPSKPGSMPRLAKAMLGELERLGAAVLLNVQAESLQLENGRVAGALARRLAGPHKGGALRIEAPAVIAGGFSNNEALMKRYKRVWADIPIGFTAVGEGVPPGHDGDGIQMGRRIGAAVEDMESMPKLYAAPRKGMRLPSWILFDTDSAYLVDRGGKRFVNEHEARYAGCAVEAFRRHMDGAYMVFDEETFRGPNSERWQLAKIFAAGGLFKGRTPALIRRGFEKRLSALMPMRPEALTANTAGAIVCFARSEGLFMCPRLLGLCASRPRAVWRSIQTLSSFERRMSRLLRGSMRPALHAVRFPRVFAMCSRAPSSQEKMPLKVRRRSGLSLERLCRRLRHQRRSASGGSVLFARILPKAAECGRFLPDAAGSVRLR